MRPHELYRVRSIIPDNALREAKYRGATTYITLAQAQA